MIYKYLTMARKDDILISFLSHELLKTKYKVKQSDLPSSVIEALDSEIPIIKTIALIVDGLERTQPITDSALRSQVMQFLNTEIL